MIVAKWAANFSRSSLLALQIALACRCFASCALLTILLVLTWSSRGVAQTPDTLAGQWHGEARCGNLLKLAALYPKQHSGGTYLGELSVNRLFSGVPVSLSLVGSGQVSIKQTKRVGFAVQKGDRFYLSSSDFINRTTELLSMESGAAFLIVARPSSQCDTLYLVKVAHTPQSQRAAAYADDFNEYCESVVQAWFRPAAEAITAMTRFKEQNKFLLEQYDPLTALAASLGSDQNTQVAFGKVFSEMSTPERGALIDHLQMCIRYSWNRKEMSKLAEPIWRDLVTGWQRQFPNVDIRHQFARKSELSVSTEQLVEANRRQSDPALWQAIVDDLDEIRNMKETSDLQVELQRLLRSRARDLSFLPPEHIMEYVAAIVARIDMLKAAQELMRNWQLDQLPKLPAPSAEAQKTLSDDSFLKPLTDEQFRELSAGARSAK